MGQMEKNGRGKGRTLGRKKGNVKDDQGKEGWKNI